MLAAILAGTGSLELQDLKIPKPSAGEVIVRVKAALTCGTDLKAFLRGHPMIPMPGLFGHEFSGVISETGKGVKGFKPGDEIMAVHSAPCLKCGYCRKGLHNLCDSIMQTKVLGAFAEYILLPTHIVKQNLFHKPKKMSFEEAAFLEPLSCVVHGMEDLKVNRNTKALVLGAGPIGLLHQLLLQNKGADVLITGLERKRLSLAKSLGAAYAVTPDKLGNATDRFTDGMGVDYVFECTGQPAVWQSSVDYVTRGGTIILFGGCSSGATVTYDAGRLHYDELTLKGVFHFTPADVKEAYTLLKKGGIKVSKLISGSYPLKNISKAFGKLTKGEGVKYVIRP